MRGSVAICARDSIWKVPMVSAFCISSNVGGVVFGDMGEVDAPAPLVCEFHCVLQHRHHAEAEQIDFDDAQVFGNRPCPIAPPPFPAWRRFPRGRFHPVGPGK